MTCPDNNFSANRPPTGNDDPCDTSGEGIYSAGSYWMYDGSDPANYGDCPRLYQRIGDTCTVAEWIEIPLAEMTQSADAPTATDCCPAGSLWYRPDALSGLGYDELYISYADLDADPIVCQWCRICPNLVITEVTEASQVFTQDLGVNVFVGAAYVETGQDTTVVITNPSTSHDMRICLIVEGVGWTLTNTAGDNDAIVSAGYGIEIDGGGLTISTAWLAAIETPLDLTVPIPAQSLVNCNIILTPGQTYTIRVAPIIGMLNGTFDGTVFVNTYVLRMAGTSYQA